MPADPPDSPPFEREAPIKPCPLCGKDMEHDGRWGWRCEEECGGSIEDRDDFDWDAAREAREER